MAITILRNLALAIATAALLAGCGKSSIAGSTYSGANGAIKIEFQSGGKAVVTMAGQAGDCTYAEENKSITITCQGQPAVFTKNDDGSLSGPADGMLAGTLTKQ
jgi:major membrane immunogen (membrane-anchored lipoprotein)